MAVSDNPYRNNEDWDGLIDEVNDVLENPTGDGCEPIDPIPHVPPKYRWAKSDLREMQDKIKETCEDIEFDPIPEGKVRWAQHFIDEIREKLDEAWCECDGAEGFDCPNCGDAETNVFFTDEPDTHICPSGGSGGCPVEPAGIEADIVALSNTAHQALFDYVQAQVDYCFADDFVGIKENQIEMKQDEIDSLEQLVLVACDDGPDTGCLAAQAALQAAEDELAVLEAELAGYIADRDAAEALRDASKAQCETDNASALSLLATMDQPQMTPGPDNITSDFLSGAGVRPWDFVENCGNYGVLACAPIYRFQTSSNSGSSWTTRFEDFFTPSGIPMVPPDETAIGFFLTNWGLTCFSDNPGLCPETTTTHSLVFRVIYDPPNCSPPIP